MQDSPSIQTPDLVSSFQRIWTDNHVARRENTFTRCKTRYFTISGPAAQARLSFKKMRAHSVTPKRKVHKSVTLSKAACTSSVKSDLRRISNCSSSDSTSPSHTQVTPSQTTSERVLLTSLNESRRSYISGSSSDTISAANSFVLKSPSSVNRSISPPTSTITSINANKNNADTGNCSSSDPRYLYLRNRRLLK